MSILRHALPLVLVAAACGDDGPSQTTDGGTADTTSTADAPTSDCDYTEQRDATNDDVSDTANTPEATGVTLSTRAVVCGAFEHTHFDGDITVDIDSYTFTVAADTDVLVRVFGTGAAGSSIELIGVDIYGGATFNQLVGTLTFYGSHGATAVRLPAGTYALTAFALNSAAILSTVPYRLEVVTDTPATRCPEITTGGYTEGNDGANSDGNDVIQLASGTPPALTTSTTDAPEPTNIVLAPMQNIRITGEAADIAAPDQYEDKDTYLITTGAGTNEATVLLTWPGTTTNMDFILFEENNVQPVLRGNATGQTGPELETFSIKPNTDYWLLVGARQNTTVPVTYNVTLCGATFTP